MTDADSPKTFRVEFHPGAETDLNEIYGRIRRDVGIRDALKYVARMRDACLALDLFPERGTKIDHPTEHIRSVPSHDSRYRIYFRIKEGDAVVEILYVWSGPSNPTMDRLFERSQ